MFKSWIAACFLTAAIMADEAAAGQNRPYQRSQQSIDVVSTPGATCTLVRDRHLLQVLRLPERADGNFTLDVAYVDLRKSTHDIVVTCKKLGFKERSETISYEPGVYYWVNPPCDAVASDACLNSYAKTEHIEVSYPEVVRLVLAPIKD